MGGHPKQHRRLASRSNSVAARQSQVTRLKNEPKAFNVALSASVAPRPSKIRPTHHWSSATRVQPKSLAAATNAPTYSAAPNLTMKHGYMAASKVSAAAARRAAAQALLAQHLRTKTFRPAAIKGERKTVLLKPDGQVFIRTWNWDGSSAASRKTARLSASAGEQAFAAEPGSFPSLVGNPRCDGCIGADTRTAVSAAASSIFPRTAIGQLTMRDADGGSEWCTGAMISPRHVLTAAHCVFDVETSHQALQNIAFSAARNGAAAPFGTLGWKSVRLLDQFTGQSSYDDTAANNDFAVVTLQQPIGRKTGWLGLEWTNATEVTVDLTTTGYPADKAANTMWNTSCAGTNFFNQDPANNLVQHTCDSTHGQSGSPMFDSNLNIRAVLTGGNGAGIDWATQINEFVFSTILGWVQEDGEFSGVGASTMELADKSGAAAAGANK